MNLDRDYQDYFSLIDKEVKKAYSVAAIAREQHKDAEQRIDIPVAKDLAARVEGLVSIIHSPLLKSGLAEGIRKLEKKYGKNDERVALESAEQTAKNEYYRFETKEQSIDAGVRVGVAYLTLGVVTAPLEGIESVKLIDDCIHIYYAGPIRSAGGTASAMSVMIADYLRVRFNLKEYVPTEDQVKRYAVELEDYSRLVGMQYDPKKEETEFIIKNLKVCLTGSPTEKFEVSNYKDIEGVDTPRIRGGMCLVVGEGLTLKAPKLAKRIKKFGKEFALDKSWSWLKEYKKMQTRIHSQNTQTGDNAEEDKEPLKYTPNTKYLKKVIAGRPVIAYPSRAGGFRLRYGNSRTTGIAATSLNPVTMHLLKFTAVGTQLATEYPGKATVTSPCNSIEGPVVLLDDGEVRYLKTKAEVNTLRASIKSILSLGDVLIPYGEFVSQGKRLLPASYCEEWWTLELEKSNNAKKQPKDISEFTKSRTRHDFLTFETAKSLSTEFNIPIHPKFNYFWHDLKIKELDELIEQTASAEINNNTLIYQSDSVKPILETLCISHKSEDNKIIIEDDHAKSLYQSLGCPSSSNVNKHKEKIKRHTKIMDALNSISSFTIMPKGIIRLGMKMGRPEKAERRMMKGRPQILFPCGEQGGRMRNLIASYEKGFVDSSFPTFMCPECKNITHFNFCPVCHKDTIEQRVCQKCGKATTEPTHCGMETVRYKDMKIDIRKLIDQAMKNIGMKQRPDLFKGVKGVFGAEKTVEPIEKGLLRTKYELYVNKDGTTRYDAIDVPLTHFKPKEISVSPQKLKEIGYTTDINNKPIEHDDQVIELKSQDILLSDNSDFSGVGYFMKICNFVDELLVKFYNLKPYYNIKNKEDLVGHLVIGLAPHTSAGIIGRIVGFTPAKVCYATPFWHSAKRRNCLVPETNIIISNNERINIISLSDLYKQTKTHEKTVDSFGTKQKSIDYLKTFSFNQETDTIEEKKIIDIIKTPAPKHLINISLESGRNICASPEHIVLVSGKEGILKKKKLVEVNNDDLFLTAKNLEPKKNNLITEKIKKIDFVKSKSKYLYDINVEDNHNFLINDFILTNNCDGDEDSILLLMDALVNFSRSYLPTTRGAATMDAPLVLTTHLDPEEVDDEAWSVDAEGFYPLEFYEETQDYPNPWDLSVKIKLVEDFIGTPEVFHQRFMHENGDINDAPYKSYYVELQAMSEKIMAQLSLAKRIKAVDADDVAEKVLTMHFLKDIKGNLRSYSKQTLRCCDCGEKFRRVPLKGVCAKCGGKLLMTIHEGSVRKYADVSKQIIHDFRITPYLAQQFRILEEECDALFGKKARQMNLGNF